VPTTYATIGKSIPRTDGERKVTGQARYTADLQLQGLLHARLVLSPHPHALILKVDCEAARSVPGVVAVFTGEDLPTGGPDSLSRNRRPLAVDRVHVDGEPVAVVVAESVEIAQDAADLIEVEYEVLPAVTDPELSLAKDSPLVRQPKAGQDTAEATAHAAVSGEAAAETTPNTAGSTHLQRGDVEAGLAEADVVIERTYRTSWVHQLYLEPQSSIAAPDGMGNLTVWTSTQGVFVVRQDVATMLEIPQQRVKVIAMEIGGAFGAKYALIDPLVASLAWSLKRPVSLVFTRSEEMRSGNPAASSMFKVTTGAKKDGTLTALKARVVFDSGCFPGGNMGIACMILAGAYQWPNVDVEGYEVFTHKTGSSAYRAPGAPQAVFAIEGQIDEMARALSLDPIEFRINNAIREGDPIAGAGPMARHGGLECLKAIAEHPAWKNRATVPGEGVGVALGWWPGAMQPATATCQLNEDGTLSVSVGSTDISGSNTSLALIAAEAFGVPVSQVDLRSGDTDSAPFSGPSGGSKTVYTVGVAVQRAAEDAARQVRAIAAQTLEAAPEDLELVEGEVRVKGVPGRTISMAKIGAMSRNWFGSFEPVQGRGGSAITTGAPQFTAHLARVAVDEETGRVTLLEYVAAQDVGCAINPAEVEGQIHGGTVQGIGFAMQEAIPYGEDGRLMGSTLMDYAVPNAALVPEIQTILIEVPAPSGPFGAKGVGEPPITAPPAAIGNAILNAVGVRPRSLPMTAERVLAALGEKDR
jgi:CO/xanthine dehydrogenase Mo-binding subunit